MVLELGYVTDEQMRQTIRRNQGELRIGDLLGGLGYLSDEELDRALALQAQISFISWVFLYPSPSMSRAETLTSKAFRTLPIPMGAGFRG